VTSSSGFGLPGVTSNAAVGPSDSLITSVYISELVASPVLIKSIVPEDNNKQTMISLDSSVIDIIFSATY
jgi:hypothetical protein